MTGRRWEKNLPAKMVNRTWYFATLSERKDNELDTLKHKEKERKISTVRCFHGDECAEIGG